MGASGFGTLAEPLPRPHRGDLRPAGRRAQHEGRSGQPVHARAARRRPASAHRRARCRPGRPVRQQRRRGQRARPRGDAPGAGPDARRARAAARLDPARSRGRDGGHPGDPRHVRAQRLRCRHGAVHRRRGPPRGRSTRRSSSQPAPDPAMFGLPDRGRRQPDRPAAGPEHRRPARTTSPTSTPCGRPRPGSCSARAPSRRARWRTAARWPSPSGWARRP